MIGTGKKTGDITTEPRDCERVRGYANIFGDLNVMDRLLEKHDLAKTIKEDMENTVLFVINWIFNLKYFHIEIS